MTVIAVIGILPYISLQLKAVSTSFTILLQYPEIVMPAQAGAVADPAGHRVLGRAAPGRVHDPVRHAPPRRHRAPRGHGRGDRLRVAGQAARVPRGRRVRHLRHLRRLRRHLRARARPTRSSRALLTPLEGVAGGYASWVWLTVLSMLAIMFLPRQFQVAVVENVDEKPPQQGDLAVPALPAGDQHLRAADRLRRRCCTFPDGSVDADTFVLTLPMAEKQEVLALLVFIGGLSAATGMVIVETIALSTMVCNDLVMPVLLRLRRCA